MNWDKIEMPTATATAEEDRSPTKEELKTFQSSAVRSRDRFVVTALSSSGLRIGTLISLKVGNVDLKTYSVSRFLCHVMLAGVGVLV